MEENMETKRTYYPNGRLESEIKYKDGKLNGVCRFYYKNGQRWQECTYKDDELNGLYRDWGKDGKLRWAVYYLKGKQSSKEEYEKERRVTMPIATEKSNRQRFWMCFVDGGESPNHKHYAHSIAVKEAERLAELTRRDVFVLEATNFVRFAPPIPLPSIQWKETIT